MAVVIMDLEDDKHITQVQLSRKDLGTILATIISRFGLKLGGGK